MRLQFAMLTFTALLLLACGNRKHIEEKNTAVDPPAVETTALWVNSYKGDCGAPNPEGDFLLTQSGASLTGKNWKCQYREIPGFEYEPGYIYQLKVKNGMKEGLPSLEFVEIMNKERDVEYFRLYDIWGLTHVKEQPVEGHTAPPSMEINLNTMKVQGQSWCNGYFGKIVNYNTSVVEFGPIAGTKKACPQLAQEKVFFEALAATRTYAIRNLTLGFYDENGTELLRFRKGD